MPALCLEVECFQVVAKSSTHSALEWDCDCAIVGACCLVEVVIQPVCQQSRSILFFVIFLLLLVLEAANPSFGRKEERHEQTQDRPAMLGTELGTALSGDRPAKKRSSDAEARPPGAPIKMVDGRPWSPGVCRSMHLLG
jgi:hypothetical protein